MNIIPPSGYNAALYLRLSRDGDAKQESNSITNQRQILMDYAKQQGYNIAGEYIDGGVRGQRFDPAYLHQENRLSVRGKRFFIYPL